MDKHEECTCIVSDSYTLTEFWWFNKEYLRGLYQSCLAAGLPLHAKVICPFYDANELYNAPPTRGVFIKTGELGQSNTQTNRRYQMDYLPFFAIDKYAGDREGEDSCLKCKSPPPLREGPNDLCCLRQNEWLVDQISLESWHKRRLMDVNFPLKLFLLWLKYLQWNVIKGTTTSSGLNV